jgi:hypothetical protein
MRMRLPDLAPQPAAHTDDIRAPQLGEAFDDPPVSKEATAETGDGARKPSGAMNKDPRVLFQDHRTPSRFSLFGRR